VTIILAFIAIYIIWGSTYLLNKMAVAELPPLFISSIRFFTASLIIFSIARAMKLNLKISKEQLKNSAFLGFLFLVYGNGIFVWALKYVDSGFAALMAATQPLIVLILLRVLEHKKIQPRSMIGIVLGIIGMYLLVSQQGLSTNENMTLGLLMMSSCVLVWSYASIYVGKANLPDNYFVSSGYQMLIAGVMLSLCSVIIGETWVAPSEWSTTVQWSMLLLIIFGSIVAFTAFNYLLKVVSPEKVTTSAFVNPIVALFLGWYILDEQLTTQSMVASGILLTGVYFITSRKRDGKKVRLSVLRKRV